MANLVYRKSSSPVSNVATTFKGSPLSNDELDNNLFGIDAEVQLKAPIANAVFTGTTTIPSIIATGGSINNTTIGATGASSGAFTTISSTGNAAINGGSLTTSATTFNLVNTTATTVNIAGAGTTVLIGATTGLTTVRNALAVTGDFSVNTNKFNVAASTGNTLVAGTLGVTGVSTLADVNATSGAFTSLTSSTTLGVTTSATIGTTLGVTGATTLAAMSATTGSFSGQLTSTVAIGTAPFVVTSTTKVANLNADRVDDFSADQVNTASTIVVRDASKNINISNAVMSGSTSGTTTLQPTAISGTSVITLPAATDTLVGKATTDTLTNKTVNLTSNTLTGTLAQFNTALSDADFVSIAGTETLTNKTLTSPAINTAVISGGTINNTVIGGTTRAAGSFTDLAVTSSATIGTTLDVTGDIAVNGGDLTTTATTFNLIDTTATTLNLGRAATAIVIGAATGTTTVRNGLTSTGNATFSGTANSVGDFSVNTNKFNVTAASGNTTVAGTLGVTGNTILSTLTATAITATSLGASAAVTGSTLVSTVATGTAPLTVTSTTRVTNLNADTVDGMNFATVNVGGVLGVDQRGGVAYALDANNITYVPPGSASQLLQSNGLNSPPTWVSPTGLSAGSSALAANVSGGTAGQLLYQSAVDNTAKLPIGATNTILTSSGTLPQWSSSLSLGGTLAVTGNTTLTGTLSHGGLVPSAGTNIDQIYSATDASLVVTTSWVSTSVNFAELATGSYMVQVNTGTEYYTGMMSWYSADINAVLTDEIILHRASAGGETSNLFLRVERTDSDLDPVGAASLNMTLQISSSVTRTAASYTYKFRRMI